MADAGVAEYAADSPQDFLSVLDTASDVWDWDDARCRPGWLFRGQSDASWPLLPTAWRILNASPTMAAACQTMSERLGPTPTIEGMLRMGFLPEPPNFNLEAARQVIVQANAELALISDFVHTADDLGFHIPGPQPPELHGAGLFEPGRPIAADDFLDLQFSADQAALAQHHGVPTRLMDWTEYPLIAAFFALEEENAAEASCVWCLRESVSQSISVPAWADAYCRLRILRPARALNPNLRAQHGAFTVLYGAGLYALLNDGRFPSIETLAESTPNDGVLLRKITLSREHVGEALEMIGRQGIRRDVLMPSLDNAARAVASRWR
jgi:FRG domain